MGALEWIQVDAGFSRSATVKRLANTLGLHRQQVVGMFVDLWEWSVENSDRGWVRGGEATFLIEDAAGWTGERGAFVRAALAVERAPLEANAAGDLRIKGWRRYARLLELREAAKRRKSKQRDEEDAPVTREFANQGVTVREPERDGHAKVREPSLSSLPLVSSKGVQGEAPTVPGAVMDEVTDAYAKARGGAAFDWNRVEEAALRGLQAKGADAEVLRRWRIALSLKWPRCSSLKTLLAQWNDFAAEPEAPKSFTKPQQANGYVKAEKGPWTEEESNGVF